MNRQRALFSCDRCKTKKTACLRLLRATGIDDPCATCIAVGTECRTTISRKKRSLSSNNAAASTHYMTEIIAALYPDVDVGSTAALAALRERILLQMAANSAAIAESAIAESESESEAKVKPALFEDTEDIAIVYSGKSVDSLTAVPDAAFDRVIVDNDGVSHYVGTFGFTSLLTRLLTNYRRITGLDELVSLRYIRHMNRRGLIILSFSEPIDPDVLAPHQFPSVALFTRREADFYVDRFHSSHPQVLAGFRQELFARIYNSFWRHTAGVASNLTSAQYGWIYAVWIIGVSVDIFPESLMQAAYESMNRYLHVLKVLLADIVLAPSYDGIVCLHLLSIFFERTMQVETAYVLCQTAVCHAMARGFHRESITSVGAFHDSFSPGGGIQIIGSSDDTHYLWWLLFDREIKLGQYLGRLLTIPLNQVNLNYEKRFHLRADTQLDADLRMTQLDRIAYGSLCNKAKLPTSVRQLTADHLTAALRALQQYTDCFTAMPSAYRYPKALNVLEVEVLLTYHYFVLITALPFLLYLYDSTVPIFRSHCGQIAALAEAAVDAAHQLVALLDVVESSGFDKTLDYNVASYTCYAMLVFFTASVAYKSMPQLGKSAEAIDRSVARLRQYNLSRIAGSRGTLRVRRSWIEILGEDFEILEGRSGDSPLREEILEEQI